MTIITTLILATASFFLTVGSAHDVDIKPDTTTIIESWITTETEFQVSAIANPYKMLNNARSDTVLGSISFVPVVQPITVTVTSDYESKTSDQAPTESRPAASGFWTGDDPFSFVPPSSFTDAQGTSTSTNNSSEEPSSSTTTSSSSGDDTTTTSTTSTTPTDDGGVIITEDPSIPGFVTMSETTSVPAVVTSISTHTNWVMATPTAASTTSQPIMTTTSQGLGRCIRSEPGIGIAIVLLLQLL